MYSRRATCLAAALGWLSLFVSIAIAQDSEEDCQREYEALGEVSKGLPDPTRVNQDLAATIHNVGLLPGYRANIERIRKQFAARFAQPKQPWSELDWRLRSHESEVARFEQSVRDHVASPDHVQQDINYVRQFAQIAVDNQAPVWFQPDGGLYTRLSEARQRLAMLRLLDGESDALTRAAADVEKVKQEVDQIAIGFTAQILESNPMPPDGYQDSDRDQLLKTLAEKWAAEGNGREVLKAGIVGPEWTRETKWVWENSAFHKTDTSRLQAWVLVPHNDQTAARHSLNFVIDHLANDSVSTWWVSDPAQEPALVSQVLLSKISGN